MKTLLTAFTAKTLYMPVAKQVLVLLYFTSQSFLCAQSEMEAQVHRAVILQRAGGITIHVSSQEVTHGG